MRRLLIAVASLALAVAGMGLVGCGDGDGEDSVRVPQSPREFVETANWDGVHSGALVAIFSLNVPSKGEFFSLILANHFVGLGKEEAPQMLLESTSNGRLAGREVDFNGFMSVRPQDALIVYGKAFHEQQYDIDRRTFRELRAKFEEAQEGNGSGKLTACLDAAGDAEVAGLIHHFRIKGHNQDRYGVPVTWFSGDIDVPHLFDLGALLNEDPACGAQLKAVGSPSVSQLEAAKSTLRGRVKGAKVLLALDKKGVLRSFTATATVMNPPDENIALKLELRLSGNDEVGLLGSRNGRPLDALLGQFGIDSETVRNAGSDEAVIGFLKAFSRGLTGSS